MNAKAREIIQRDALRHRPVSRDSSMNTKVCVKPRKTDILAPRELADALNVPLSWVYQRSREKGENTIPKYKLGRYVRFRLSEVLDWADKRF